MVDSRLGGAGLGTVPAEKTFSGNRQHSFLGDCHDWGAAANYGNKGCCHWLAWAGAEARPTKREALPEIGNRKPSDHWQLTTLFSK